MKKKIVILSFIGLLLAVWAFAVWNINATAEKPIVETYSMQDTVAYGENYFRRSDNIIDGYTVTVLSAEIVPYEEYAQKQGITPPERMTDETGNFFVRQHQAIPFMGNAVDRPHRRHLSSERNPVPAGSCPRETLSMMVCPRSA